MAIKVYEFEDQSLDYKAWIVVDSLHNGMAFGGCRFSETVNKEEVSELASCMTKKLIYHGLPVGGAKTGIQVNPTRHDISDVLSDFGKKAKSVLESEVMIGKDLGATNELIDKIYSSAGIKQTDIVVNHTKKSCPPHLRDFSGYLTHMTAQGVAWATEAVHTKQKLVGAKAMIQGAGFVGLGLVYRLQALGVEVIGISDAEKAIISDVPMTFETVKSMVDKGRLQSPKDRQVIKRDDLLSQDCDLLFLAASSNSVDDRLADKIKAKMVVEGSNFGLTSLARETLQRRGVPVLPDILANSSSAAMVAFQMATANGMDKERLWSGIRKNIEKVCLESFQLSQDKKISMRQAYVDHIFPNLKANLNSAIF